MISVVIPTIGRESLGRAVASALGQDMPGGNVEVIVVNDSGCELNTAANILGDPRVVVITTNCRRQRVARNTGAAIARGRYLVFLDDDDWLAAGALAALLEAILTDSRFVAAYGGALLFDITDRPLGCLNLGVSGNCASQMLGGATIPIGSGIIDAHAFFTVGGLDTTLPNGDEVDLFRGLAMVGDFANTARIVVNVLRGEGWRTSVNYARPSVESLLVSREHLLDHSGAFHRLLQSADSPYWARAASISYHGLIWARAWSD